LRDLGNGKHSNFKTHFAAKVVLSVLNHKVNAAAAAAAAAVVVVVVVVV
jgi:hypothetical protein